MIYAIYMEFYNFDDIKARALQKELHLFGFGPYSGDVQDNLYISRHGPESKQNAVTAVHAVLAVQHLNKKFEWFWKDMQKLRLLRIEEEMPLVDAIVEEK